ncbi:MAG: molybdopterin-dependent oxidoreductase, partial [Alkaliphilus sp.]
MNNIKKVITTCPRDCPDTCGIIVEVEKGKILRLRGAKEHPVTKGFLCSKMHKYPDLVYSKERLKRPLLRKGSRFIEISFSEAYSIAAREIEKTINKYSAKSILYYQGSGSLSAMRLVYARFFNLLGGVTRNSGGLCLENAVKAQEKDFGTGRVSNTPLDVINSRLIIFWGRNAAETNLHLFREAKEAQKKGAVVVTIDPRESRTAMSSDLHIRINPGTDWALALLLIKHIIKENKHNKEFIKDHCRGWDGFKSMVDNFQEENLLQATGVDEKALRKLIDYLDLYPAAICLGVGMTYWSWGVDTVRLINALGAVLGILGVRGGGVNLSFPGWNCFDASLSGREFSKGERFVSETSLGEEMIKLDAPPVKLAWVIGGNPLLQNPNSNKVWQAFKSLDFIMVNDLFLTDTARMADLIFPVASFLERTDVTGSWGHNYIGPVNPVINTSLPSDLEILQEVSALLGFAHEMKGT